jgi:hypothetical protein
MSTQMLPSPLASQFGPDEPVGPTVIVATILFVTGSIRNTFPSWTSATHTADAVARTPFGARPTFIVATSWEVAGSMRKSVPVLNSVTHTPFASAETP